MKVARFEFSLFGINTYVVYDPDTSECAIIDPAMMGKEEEEAMDGFIKKNALKVVGVVNTHLHIDHAIGNAYAVSQYSAPVLAHKEDEFLGEHINQQARMFGMSEEAEPFIISQYIKDGDEIKIGNGKLDVIHLPGHSPGSIALYDRAGGFIISGDVLFAHSVGRTDLPGGSWPILVKNIKDKLLVLPDTTMVYPGHGPATTIGEERAHNPFLKDTL